MQRDCQGRGISCRKGVWFLPASGTCETGYAWAVGLAVLYAVCLGAGVASANGLGGEVEGLPAIARGTMAAPAVNGPRAVGGTPGRPFLFRIPATGEGPLRYAATGLPAGLTLNAETGIISGTVREAGTTVVEVTVTGPRGTARRALTIVAGERKLALTPPMGWNSWYACSVSVDEGMVRGAADGLVETGLAAHGYQYVCIDDSWADGRDAAGAIKRIPKKFRDMKMLGDYLHSKGLKFGIYSSPGPKTCTGYEGSYGHELQDARTFAAWGVDFLKYDWCSYEAIAKDHSVAELQRPYRVMRAALDQCGRDMVYGLCQYGRGDVWMWGADVGGNLWRTTGDIGADWASVADIGFSQDALAPYAGPGHWNDPDMLMIAGLDDPDRALTPMEELTQFTLWTLLAAPLILSCDLSQLDPWTIDLLTNDEVIAVNQDPLGEAARRRARDGSMEVWARPLWDGTLAVGLFNRGPTPAAVTAKWSDLDLKGRRRVRDLWQRKKLGEFDGAFTATVASHGAVLVKVGPTSRVMRPRS